MADVSTGQATASAPGASSGTAMSKRDGAAGGLQSEKGQTTIADPVVTKVAGIATREVAGVHSLGGGVARALGAVTQRLPVAARTPARASPSRWARPRPPST